MKRLYDRRLKLVEVQAASIEDLLDAQNKVFISKSENWETLAYNRNMLERELVKRAKQDEIANHHAAEEILIANS